MIDEGKPTPAGPPPAYTPPVGQSSRPRSTPSLMGQPRQPAGVYSPVQDRGVFDMSRSVDVGPQGPIGQGPYRQYPAQPMNTPVILSVNPADPRSICAQQGHIRSTTFGILGVLFAIVCFPIGLVCCVMDRREQCTRCGEIFYSGCQ
ncbi:hypothetical protein DACRYDRAFT_20765 [Dacryopinax primogenitus]|uniref:Uncharacterized protein n=1 Tax=Dacryopinax primogenitus (strain DJM 731) TaxID=1858805 RepID=M5G7J3_DACPD|nr:uncharacterized protein DACRYDRAFT_20765 [Dacryopinax primogenitus]EJU04140.1 hypothetical protein DACRYDRAFT_20765 [Dacryopinax primogenitus]